MSGDSKSVRHEPIALSGESTVVAEFLPDNLGVREAAYQSEAGKESINDDAVFEIELIKQVAINVDTGWARSSIVFSV